jgi:hypothetical protein
MLTDVDPKPVPPDTLVCGPEVQLSVGPAEL